MSPSVPPELLSRASRWRELKRWERRELGQELRQLGLSYGEISRVIPVGKGTLSFWCRDVTLSERQLQRLGEIRPTLEARVRLGNRRRAAAHDRVRYIRDRAQSEVITLVRDSLWLAGVVAYWAEGAKRSGNELRFTNSDPAMIRLFLRWTKEYLGVDDADFDVRLHLHGGQEESERRRYWSQETGIPVDAFKKAYIKPEGTGHRKNVLYNGTASVRVRRSNAKFHRVMGWIEGVSKTWAASSTG